MFPPSKANSHPAIDVFEMVPPKRRNDDRFPGLENALIAASVFYEVHSVVVRKLAQPNQTKGLVRHNLSRARIGEKYDAFPAEHLIEKRRNASPVGVHVGSVPR